MSAKVVPTAVSAPASCGSPFVIERMKFNSARQVDFAMAKIDECRVYDWPMVYILANKREAYVGQTTSVARRMEQHGANPAKDEFTDCNVIYNAEFNRSVLDDYEHRLIELMNADGRYTITNKNAGLADYNYFGKHQYAAMFEDLWAELRDFELVDHAISELEESEVFKYSPFKVLSADQRVALDRILDAVTAGLENPSPIVVEGMPGTGKTVLAVFLLKFLKDDKRFRDLNVKLLEPMDSLRETLRRSLKGVSGLSDSDIIGPSDIVKPKFGFRGADEKGYDIILVDEAHRLKRYKNLVARGAFKKTCSTLGLPHETSTQLDWVLSQARLPILFYDPMQVIGPSGLGDAQMRASLGPCLDNPVVLESQMRAKGGRSYLEHVSSMLRGGDPVPFDESAYEFVLHDDFADFAASFERTLAGHSLTRMVAGYAWPWATKGLNPHEHPDETDIEIDGLRFRWNSVQKDWVGKGVDDPLVAHEMGSIHSMQGYDLSYAYVVVGPDLVLGEDGLPRCDRNSYYDKNGKNTAAPEELDEYVRNIYYVLMTRGVHGTHVYVCDPALREHVARFFAQR